MLSIAHQFLFIHIPKTAGNAVHKALLPFSEDVPVRTAPHQDGVERFGIQSPNVDVRKHSTLAEYQVQLSRDTWGRLFKFTCVRNPWDRCVSSFFSPHRGAVEWSAAAFEQFIRRRVAPSHEFLALGGDEDKIAAFRNVDMVMRFERLESDFVMVCEKIGLAPPRLDRINVSTRGDYRRYYRDDDVIELIARRFAPEIEFFGYDFDQR